MLLKNIKPFLLGLTKKSRHERNPVARYGFIRPNITGRSVGPDTIPPMTINWVILPFSKGAGGHTTIFRFVHYLEKEGFDCRIIIVDNESPLSKEKIKTQINEWFFPFKGQVYVGMDAAPPASVTIATFWSTAYYVRDFQPTLHRIYFVQDFEPYFYATGSHSAWAEETYRFGFIGITAGTWLREKLAIEYGMKTKEFLFSFDRDKYFQRTKKPSQVRQVFFYARPSTQRRAFEMGILVLDEVKRRLPDIKIILAGGKTNKFDIPFEHASMGVVSVDTLSEIYGQCDAALVLSFTNLSLLPLELMACGIPVVSNRAPCTEWLLNDENACLCPPTVEALADGVCMVLNDQVLASRLRDSGLAAAAATDWEEEAQRIGQFLRTIEAEGPTL